MVTNCLNAPLLWSELLLLQPIMSETKPITRTRENAKNARRKAQRSWKKTVHLLRLEKANVIVVEKQTTIVLIAPNAFQPPSLSGALTRTRKFKPTSN